MKLVAMAVASLLSGLMLSLSLPPVAWNWLGWICLVPVLIATRQSRFIAGFVCGLLAGFTAAFCSANGFLSQIRHGGESSAWTYAALLIFGLMIGSVAGVWAEQKTVRLPNLVLLASLGVSLEGATLLLLPMNLGLSQFTSWPCLELSRFGSIWLVSFVVWLSNLAIANLLADRTWKPALAILAVCALSSWLKPPAIPGDVKVAAIQTQSLFLDDLLGMQQDAEDQGATIVVWPELSALSIASNGDTQELVEASKSTVPFVTTYRAPAEPLPHNVASLFSGGQELGKYAKRKPFAGERSVHSPGNRPVAVPWNRRTVGLNICFDSCYPSIIRDTAHLDGVCLIALPTLDPDSDGAVVQALHAAYTPFRAVENGLPIIRAEATGFSMIVAANGSIIDQLGVEPDKVLVGSVELGPRWAPARFIGDSVLWICLSCVLISIMRGITRK